MKKSLALLLTLALTVMCSMAVFTVGAADETAVSVSIEKSGTDEFKITGAVTNAVPNQQITVLAVKTAKLANPDTIGEDDIAYIDQFAVEADIEGNAEFTYKMKLREGFVPAECTLLHGGTAILAANQSQELFPAGGELPPVGYTVSGTATPAEYVTEVGKITATLYNTEDAPLQSVKADETGKYEFKDVANGSYYVVVSKPGFLARTFEEVTVNGANVTLDATALIAGDVNGDEVVDPVDVKAIIKILNLEFGDEDYNESCDMNRDEAIDPVDVKAAIKNLNKESLDY